MNDQTKYKEIKDERQELERKINELVQDYESRTGLQIEINKYSIGMRALLGDYSGLSVFTVVISVV